MSAEITLEPMNPLREEREAHWARANRDELVERMARDPRRWDGWPLKGLFLRRASSTKEALYTLVDPDFCVIAQGSKEIFLGNQRYQYDPAHYLLISAELPLVGQVLEASRERPYFGLRLKLDSTLMSPLQFQKRLRLQEARRLMLGEGLDAASAAYRVGDHDAAYFNREYKSHFGLPPMRDIERLRETAQPALR